jgi:hypothetical protein
MRLKEAREKNKLAHFISANPLLAVSFAETF